MQLAPASPRTDSVEIGPALHPLRDACLLSCESGEVRVRSSQGDCARLGEGDLLRLSTEEGCSARSAGSHARIRVLIVGSDWIHDALGLGGGDATLAEPLFRIERAPSPEARRARRIFEQLFAPAAGWDRARRRRDAALRLELLALALEALPSDPAQAGPRRPNPCRAALIQRVAGLREASLEEVSLASVAQEVGLSERQVSRLFREEFGTTFRDHLAALRLERAKRLLAGTDLSVIEVAGHTGWSSLAHFNSVFRRQVGVTPSSFRAGGLSLPAA
jgi:AraC-like DNA-binding protein